MKHLYDISSFLNEKKPAGAPDWHDSDAPDANGRFRDLSPKDLAAWLIKTRKKDLKRISGSLTQQVVFNRNDDPEYADKMERTRKEVYKQLGREDLLKESDESYISEMTYGQLEKCIDYSAMIRERMDEGQELDDWMHSQVTVAEDKLLSVYSALDGEDGVVEGAIKPDIRRMLTKISGAIGYKQDPNMRQDLLAKIEDAIKEVMAAHDYVVEADKKPGPDAYMTGLDDETEEEKEEQMKKQAEMDDDDPEAYKELPGDEEAREKGKVKTSKHVKSYHELYGDDKNEALSDYEEEDEADYEELYKDYGYRDKNKKRRRKNESTITEAKNSKQIKELEKLLKSIKSNTPAAQGKKAAIQDDIERLKNESLVTEEKAKGDRGKIDDSAIETGLKNKADETGVPIALLRIVMRRGMAAWKTGHRPGATQQQWGYARVNSFLTKQPGTWGGADKDVAKEVRDGGHDKKLKKA